MHIAGGGGMTMRLWERLQNSAGIPEIPQVKYLVMAGRNAPSTKGDCDQCHNVM